MIKFVFSFDWGALKNILFSSSLNLKYNMGTTKYAIVSRWNIIVVRNLSFFVFQKRSSSDQRNVVHQRHFVHVQRNSNKASAVYKHFSVRVTGELYLGPKGRSKRRIKIAAAVSPTRSLMISVRCFRFSSSRLSTIYCRIQCHFFSASVPRK